jgi:membrane-associated phospholipid phosphatase
MTFSRSWRGSTILAIVILITASAAAQTTQSGASPKTQPSQTKQTTRSPSLESRFFKNILRDQQAIWTSPFRMHERDAHWLAPLGLTTAALVATDRHTAGALGDDHTRLTVSRDISQIGAAYTTAGIAATFYLIGRARHDARARETGILGAEALIDSGIVVQVLKAATQRPRPRVDDASGEFFDRGNSFPSGHAISAWSLATVIAQEYGQHRPLVRVAAYGLATAVSLARYTGRNHFLSDSLVGSAMGYGIGRYVYGRHHDPDLDMNNVPSHSHSKLLPLAMPMYNGRARTLGLRLAWNF